MTPSYPSSLQISFFIFEFKDAEPPGTPDFWLMEEFTDVVMTSWEKLQSMLNLNEPIERTVTSHQASPDKVVTKGAIKIVWLD